MELRRFSEVDDFLAMAGDYLSAREAEHNLIFGICSNLRATPTMFGGPPYLAVVTDRGRVVAAALRTPPHRMILSEIDDAPRSSWSSTTRDHRSFRGSLARKSMPGPSSRPGPLAAVHRPDSRSRSGSTGWHVSGRRARSRARCESPRRPTATSSWPGPRASCATRSGRRPGRDRVDRRPLAVRTGAHPLPVGGWRTHVARRGRRAPRRTGSGSDRSTRLPPSGAGVRRAPSSRREPGGARWRSPLLLPVHGPREPDLEPRLPWTSATSLCATWTATRSTPPEGAGAYPSSSQPAARQSSANRSSAASSLTEARISVMTRSTPASR